MVHDGIHFQENGPTVVIHWNPNYKCMGQCTSTILGSYGGGGGPPKKNKKTPS